MTARRSDPATVAGRVAACLVRCLDLSRDGRYRRVLEEVERVLPLTAEHPNLEAQLQVWKAQALLSMGLLERAVTAARRSWSLEPSAHACHLLASALHRTGESEDAEDLLREGLRRYPEAEHLALQLAVSLADQARVPEALDLVADLSLEQLGEDLQEFASGLRVNLLAASGKWGEAEAVLRTALRRHPESPRLMQTRSELAANARRIEAEAALASSWQDGLDEPLCAAGAEVDDAIVRLASTLELSPLQALAAQRLWRALWSTAGVRPAAYAAWATAVMAAVLELDDEPVPSSALARACRVRADTVRSALTRVRSFLGGLDPEFAARAFAATTNPRLEEPATDRSAGRVVPFPARGGQT